MAGIAGGLEPGELIYILSGVIPNRRSTPVVDAWFGLRYTAGGFQGVLSMEQVLSQSGYGRSDATNQNVLTEEDIQAAQALLPQAAGQALDYMAEKSAQYRARIAPQIEQERNKLRELEARHKQAIWQMSLFDSVKTRREQEVETLFQRLSHWVRDTLEIEDKPYLRVIAVLKGV